VRNSLFGIAGQAVGGVLFFLVALLIARYLGPDRFGAFSFVFAYVSVFQMLADFGLSNILIREIARDRQKVDEILGAVVPLVTLIAFAAYGLIALSVQFLSLSAEAAKAMYIMGAMVLVTFPSAVYGAVNRAFEEMGFNAFCTVLQHLILLIAVLLAIYLEAGLDGFAFCYLAEWFFQWAFFRVLIRVRYSHYHWRFDPDYWHYLVREGLPVGAGIVLRRVSWYVDTFILMALSSTSSVGLFNAAYRVVKMVNVIPFTLAMPLYPVLSRLGIESSEKTFSLYNHAQKIFLLIGLPVCFWIILLGPQIILLLFGEGYLAAGTALRLMGLVALLLFLNSLYVYLFSALGKQKWYMISIGISVLINILLDFLLIPKLDILGAALGTLSAEIVLYFAGYLQLARLGRVKPFFQLLMKPFLASLLAGGVLLWPLLSPSWLSLILGSMGYGLLFLLLAFAFRALTQDELNILRATLPGRGKAQADDTQTVRSAS
jgi:O-antigen/teichoic acid export membrane protein